MPEIVRDISRPCAYDGPMSTEQTPADRFTRAELTAIANAIQALEFDETFRIDAETGAITPTRDELGGHVYAPTVWHDDETDVQIEDAYWHAMTGLTGQDGYHGAVLHSSEVMSGSWGVVAAMLDVQDGADTVWAQTTVEVNGCGDDFCSGVDCPGGADPAGWAIVYRQLPAERTDVGAPTD